MNRTPIVDREIPDRLIFLGRMAWWCGACVAWLARVIRRA
jgi:hypothetical protein